MENKLIVNNVCLECGKPAIDGKYCRLHWSDNQTREELNRRESDDEGERNETE